MPSALETGLTTQGISYERNGCIQSTLLTSRADMVIHPNSPEQVEALLPMLMEANMPYHILGGGSNSLLTGTDKAPLQTVIIDTGRLKKVKVNGETGDVTAEAGVKIATVSRVSAQSQLSGLEFACGVPGSTAGAVVTDAWHPIHNYGDEFEVRKIDHTQIPKHMRTVLTGVDVIGSDGVIREMTTAELGMQNRSSIFLEPGNTLFLLRAKFHLTPGDQSLIEEVRDVVCLGRANMRKANKAKNKHSVGKTLGYTFVLNHPDYKGKSAMQLITESHSLPQFVSEKGMMHSKNTPNIVCNTGNGNPEGYLRIIENIQDAVRRDHGIEMPVEVRIIS